MLAKDKIFREYDIRGVVDSDFDEEFARELGRAFGAKAHATFERAPGTGVRIAVGRDCRVSGEKLAAALMAGLQDAGVAVVDCGMGPTPQLYHAVFSRALDGGIQVTGSHNPADQNGFKMMIGRTTLSGTAIQDLRERIATHRAGGFIPTAGPEPEQFDARAPYIADLVERSRPEMGQRKLKVVVDAGNGVGGLVGPEVLRALGCEVLELYTEPDGTFPNHHPDPTELENIVELRRKVVEEGADLGIGYDGDADRIGVIDQKGEPIYGDMLLLIYGRHLVKHVEHPTIIGDVKCSEVVFRELEKAGAKPVMAKTGHSLIKAKLKELDAELAGEMSGHVFFVHRYYGFDDAIHATARLVEILSHTEGSVSDLLADVPPVFSTPELRFDCPDEVKFRVVETAQKSFPEFEVNTLDGARITFPYGWGLVRASNTQAALVMRFEADSADRLSEYRSLVEDRVASIRDQLL
ncbi:MAG: phosphomannomutase/phosphoglucomutase [Bdellovibrionales bacterium]|nr:phosphomannomutase/phosphoglucomutase [Bdellovibrionales bacterium]